MNQNLEQKLKDLPRSPGVYFHKSKTGEIIYVGKAAVLKNRVRQYFHISRDHDIKTRALVEEISDVDWVETESEIDALFLESEMVKRYMPRYNILLRDDKSQIYVRINMRDEWPHVELTRAPAGDEADYYGPFYNAYPLRKALRYLRKTFPYYVRPPKTHDRPSLDAHLGLEPYGITSDEYKAQLRKLVSYIKGNRVALTRELETEMKQAAKEKDFERAAELRNRLHNLRELKRRIMFGDKEFLSISKDRALTQLVDILGLESPPARIEGYDISHMSGRDVVASQVVFVNGVSSRADYRKYKLKKQQNDDYASMHETIYRRFSEKNIKSWGKPHLLLIDGGKGQLGAALDALEQRNISIPTISLAKREEELIINSLRSNVDVAKLKSNDSMTVLVESDWMTLNLHPGQRNAGAHSKNLLAEVNPSKYSDVIKLFQRIRDEAHRFAVSYHTTLKRTNAKKNILEEISGIGPETRRKLMRKFGSVRQITLASEDDIAAVVGASKAKVIHNALRVK